MSSPAATPGSVHGHPLGPDSRLAPKPGLVVVPVDGETVVYDPEADALHHLNRTASTVWSRVDGRLTLQVLAERVAADYGATGATLSRDIVDLAGALWDRGLLSGSTTNPTAISRQSVGLGIDSGLLDGPLSTPLSELRLGDQPLPESPHRTGAYRALEHVFDVATNDSTVRDFLQDVLIDLAHSEVAETARYEVLDLGAGAAGGPYLVRFNGQPVAATDWLDRALAVMLWHVNAEVVRRSTPRYPLIHAAAAVSHGVAVLLPAPAESGKTTTVAGLVRAGFGYLTDEAVAIDPRTLLAQPYPKALSVDRGSWEVLADLRPPHSDRVTGQWQLPPRSIRADAVAEAVPVRFVVAPAYSRDAVTELVQMSKGEMLVRLADSTFQFQSAPQRNLDVLARMLQQADCYRLTLSDLADGIRLIADLVRSEELDVSEGELPVPQRGH